MTQRLKGLDNIRRAMERRVEEREDVMRAEARHLKGEQGEDSLFARETPGDTAS